MTLTNQPGCGQGVAPRRTAKILHSITRLDVGFLEDILWRIDPIPELKDKKPSIENECLA
jgi:hypothetical protein